MSLQRYGKPVQFTFGIACSEDFTAEKVAEELTIKEVGKEGVCCRSLHSCRAGCRLLRPEACHVLPGYACEGAGVCRGGFWGRRGQHEQAPVVELR